MALPPERLRAHERRGSGARELAEATVRRLELVARHVIGVATERGDAEAAVRGVRSRCAPPAEAGEVHVLDARGRERVAQRVLAELRLRCDPGALRMSASVRTPASASVRVNASALAVP